MVNDLTSWFSEIREVLNDSSTPVTIRNGLWQVSDKESLWKALGPRIFDEDLDTLSEVTVKVLSEPDPKFDLPPSERYAAVVYGKEPKYSYELRRGLAETQVLLATQPGALTNCSQHKAETVSRLAVRKILEAAQWNLWATLGDLLPLLAEASPDEFLSALEGALRQDPCPLDMLFAQESAGVTGGNYLIGLLWALETLAWYEEYLVRVCVDLAKLGERDSGGNWYPRPLSSLTSILLPWFPNTRATVEKRNVAVKTVQEEVPTEGWQLLTNLLPEQVQSASPTHKPAWRNSVPTDWEPQVPQSEYWDCISYCADLAMQVATDDKSKLLELVDLLDCLPEETLLRLMAYLSSLKDVGDDQEYLFKLWNKLTRLLWKHQRFPDATWAWDRETLESVDAATKKLAPSEPALLHRLKFDSDVLALHDEEGDQKVQEEQRQQAINEILANGGVEAVVHFVESVESTYSVGRSLAEVASDEIDQFLLPSFLENNDKRASEFTRAYVWARRNTMGWEWVDRLDRSEWSISQSSRLLTYLPFDEETWTRSTNWLGQDERKYWQNDALITRFAEANFRPAVDKLLQYGRPGDALACLGSIFIREKTLDIDRTIKTLLAIAESNEQLTSIEPYHITNLIEALQKDDRTDREDLIKVEWAYVALLDGRRAPSPKTLESELSGNPEFFCQIIRLLYRPRGDAASVQEPSKETQAAASNAWKLLNGWRTPPAVLPDGSISSAQFEDWLSRVKAGCNATGHVEVGMNQVGQVLFHTPADPDTLWIDRTVAAALNEEDAGSLRKGYVTGAFNARGVYRVDPSGSPERDLANQYRRKAEDVENAGYFRLATELRGLAERYDLEAERIVSRYDTDA